MSIARGVRLPRKNHAGSQHSLETAYPVAKIGDLFAHLRQISRGGARPLVKEDDLAQRPYRIAVEAHAAAVSFRRRAAGARADDPVKVLTTAR